MSLRAQLLAQLSRYDDEAFVALANRGLLRRAHKDLETVVAEIRQESDEALIVSFGSFDIQFDKRGPAQAVCSCPSSSICQHILAAAIWLQRENNQENESSIAQNDRAAIDDKRATSETADTTDHSAYNNQETGELHAKLMQTSSAELTKYAGTAAYRWAWQFVHDLVLENDLQLLVDRYIVIRFPRRRIGFRYLGGGPEALITETDLASVEKYQVAAILAYQSAHGVVHAVPEPTRKKHNESLNFGKDHELADNNVSQTQSRQRLCESVRQLMFDCLRLGLSHLSSAVWERFSTLAVWAQAADYYRLARLLRHLADHVEQLLARSRDADESRLFDDMTRAYALVEALMAAERKGMVSTSLTGQARNQYDVVDSLQLLGLGAMPWRSAAGYVGLTMIFWSPKEKAFFACTDARPESQRNFNPRARFAAPGPWRGASSPAAMCGKQIQLMAAQLSANGRLSTSENTTAITSDVVSAQAFIDKLDLCNSWRELKGRYALSRQSVLAEPQPMQDWVSLRPARFGDAQFDSIRQKLIWPLYDEQGEQLNVDIPYSEDNEHAIERIENLSAGDLVNGTVLIAKIRRYGAEFSAEPLSLIYPDRANAVDVLHFDSTPAIGLVAQSLQKLKRLKPKSNQNGSSSQSTTLLLPFEALRSVLLKTAERGLSVELSHQPLAQLDAHIEKIAQMGFVEFRKLKRDLPQSVERIIRVNYMQLQYRNLLGDTNTEAQIV